MLPREVESILEELRAERIRGASWMARRGAEAYLLLADILEGAELEKALLELRRELPRTNPTMASLYNLSHFVPVTDDPSLVRSRAEEFLRLMDEARKVIGNLGSELIEDGDTVITHSFSSAVFEVLKMAKARGVGFKVILTESAPDYEGIALANALEREGIEFEIITDAQLGLFAGKATLALVGADNITRDWAVVNKAGTYPLALACHDKGVPFYVSAEGFKLHPKLTSAEVEILERPYSRNGYVVRNFLFDITPWRYVRGIITELGMIVPPREV